MRLSLQRSHFRRVFVAKASKLLAESLDYRVTLSTVCQLLVPDLADWSAIDIVQEDGSLSRLDVHHSDPAKIALVHQLQERYPQQPTDPIPRAIQSGQSELVPAIADHVIELLAQDEEHLSILRSLDLRSYIVSPLKARGRTLGAITVVMAESQREYDESDLATIEELAAIAALAIDNSRLYREAQLSERHFRELVNSLGAIVWEGDADTFQFSFVSKRAEDILGYPVHRWLEPGFWASIVAPESREWAVAYCTNATKEGRDHEFEYAAVTADGRTILLRDIVYVLRDEEGRARRLRGVMIPIRE
jgi:PAS domain S-box-containing protein